MLDWEDTALDRQEKVACLSCRSTGGFSASKSPMNCLAAVEANSTADSTVKVSLDCFTVTHSLRVDSASIKACRLCPFGGLFLGNSCSVVLAHRRTNPFLICPEIFRHRFNHSIFACSSNEWILDAEEKCIRMNAERLEIERLHHWSEPFFGQGRCRSCEVHPFCGDLVAARPTDPPSVLKKGDVLLQALG